MRLAEEVPERQVETTERHDGETLAAVRKRQRVDVVPECSNVIDGLDLGPDDQFTEVLIDYEARRFTTAAVAVPDDTVVSLHLNDDLPEV